MRRSSRLLAFAVLLAAPLASSAAQQIAPAMLPFHTGQWGAEFAGREVTTVSVMRFVSPRTALVVSVSGNFDSNHIETVSGLGSDVKSTTTNIGLRLGLRRHRSLGGSAIGSLEGGLVGQHGASHQTVDGGPTTTGNFDSYGVFGAAAAQYLFTSHIAVGAGVGLDVTRQSSRTRTPTSRYRATGISASTGLQPIRVTLYF